MKKMFLFEKHTKSREDCNKFSRSVSYETLVGGTTTECSAYKQTQHLNKGCADAPLTAVGTLTSQLCCSTKVVENLLHCHPELQTKNPEKTKTVMPGLIGHLSRIYKLSLRGAAGDVAISCVKILSFLSRCCASANQGISASASCREAHKRRFLFNSKIPGIFRLTAKNRDDSLLFLASPRTRFCEIAAPAFRLLAMTPSTLALAAVLAMGLISESRAADAPTSGTCGEGCNWSYNTTTKELTLSGNGTMNDYSTGSGGWDFGPGWKDYMSQIETVKVESGSTLSNIGELAFNGAAKLTTVDLQNITSIGDSAFSSATSLTSVDMPNVTTIGQYAFEGASSLTNIDMPNVSSIGNSAFSGASSLTNIDMPNVTTIGQNAFSGATSLESVDMPSLTYAAPSAFANATSLKYVGLGNNWRVDENGYYLDENGTPIEIDVSDWYGCEIVNGGKWEDLGHYTGRCYSALNNAYNSVFPSTPYGVSSTCGIPGGSCGSCGDGYIMSGRGCVSECGTGYMADSTTKRCVKNSAPADSSTSDTDTRPTAASCAEQGEVLQGNACVSSCGASFRLNDGECDRIRYTPAEAAQYLKDTDNEIIMTFKVNR